ncbi:MAG: substrate-binding periplasmic protein [Phycisphaerales bacterium]
MIGRPNLHRDMPGQTDSEMRHEMQPGSIDATPSAIGAGRSKRSLAEEDARRRGPNDFASDAWRVRSGCREVVPGIRRPAIRSSRRRQARALVAPAILACGLAIGAAPPASFAQGDAAAERTWTPAEGSPGSASRPLRVAVADRVPFAFKNPLGEWQGYTIELWDRVANRLDLEYEFQEWPLEDLLLAIDEGRVEASALGTAITPGRVRANHLSPAFETSAIAVATIERIGWLPSLTASFNGLEFLQLMLFLLLFFLTAATLLWIAERRAPDSHFDRRLGHGLSRGMWWAVVTFSTVGYGDTVPRTPAGRLIGAAWMLVSVVAVSLFTGVVASRITLTAGATAVSDIPDLVEARVGVVGGSLAEDVLRSIGVPSVHAADDREGIELLAAGNLDAFVSERAILHNLVGTRPDRGLRLLPRPLARDYLAFAFDEDLPQDLLEAIDIAVLEELDESDWRWVRQRYLGELLGELGDRTMSVGSDPGDSP